MAVEAGEDQRRPHAPGAGWPDGARLLHILAQSRQLIHVNFLPLPHSFSQRVSLVHQMMVPAYL